MTGTEHYREAERLIEAAGNSDFITGPEVSVMLAAAQVHATLALAGVTAVAIGPADTRAAIEWAKTIAAPSPVAGA